MNEKTEVTLECHNTVNKAPLYRIVKIVGNITVRTGDLIGGKIFRVDDILVENNAMLLVDRGYQIITIPPSSP